MLLTRLQRRIASTDWQKQSGTGIYWLLSGGVISSVLGIYPGPVSLTNVNAMVALGYISPPLGHRLILAVLHHFALPNPQFWVLNIKQVSEFRGKNLIAIRTVFRAPGAL